MKSGNFERRIDDLKKELLQNTLNLKMVINALEIGGLIKTETLLKEAEKLTDQI